MFIKKIIKFTGFLFLLKINSIKDIKTTDNLLSSFIKIIPENTNENTKQKLIIVFKKNLELKKIFELHPFSYKETELYKIVDFHKEKLSNSITDKQKTVNEMLNTLEQYHEKLIYSAQLTTFLSCFLLLSAGSFITSNSISNKLESKL